MGKNGRKSCRRWLLPAALVAAVIAVTVYLLRKFRKRK